MKIKPFTILILCAYIFFWFLIIYDTIADASIIADKRVKILFIGFIIFCSIHNIRRELEITKYQHLVFTVNLFDLLRIMYIM